VQIPNRVGELDGIRGAAILLVMLFHFGSSFSPQPSLVYAAIQQAFGFGWCGVDLFFVLSGFLITGILLDSKGSRNYFRVFYWRRVLRILPLYYAAVFALFLVFPAVSHYLGGSWPEPSPTEQLWYWFHISNWRTAFCPLVFWPASHFWSLAIEEQFYLLWPAIVLACSPRKLLRLCAVVILGCCLLRNLPLFQALNAQYYNFLYRLTPFRMDSLLFGACGALIVRDQKWTNIAKQYLGLLFVSGFLIIIAVVLVAGSTSPHSGPMTRFGYTALGLCFSCGVFYAFSHASSVDGIARFFRTPVLRSFGKYSYAMYVVHAPVAAYVLVHLGGHRVWSSGLTILARIAVTYVLALLSWNCIERHFLKLKDRLSDRPIKSPAAITAPFPT
jgi:peptidoglycan/LPS O-acetylase OafA/YrhL